MGEKCDVDGCSNNVKWQIDWKILNWKRLRFCDQHMKEKILKPKNFDDQLTAVGSVKEFGFTELRIKKVDE